VGRLAKQGVTAVLTKTGRGWGEKAAAPLGWGLSTGLGRVELFGFDIESVQGHLVQKAGEGRKGSRRWNGRAQ